jgi:hypothetical protein
VCRRKRESARLNGKRRGMVWNGKGEKEKRGKDVDDGDV